MEMEAILHVVNSMFSFIVALLSFFFAFSFCSGKETRICKYAIVNGCVFTLEGMIYLIWGINDVVLNSSDLMLIMGVLGAAKTIMVLIIIFSLTDQGHFLYIIFLYFLSALAIFTSMQHFFIFLSAISALAILIASAGIIHSTHVPLRHAGYISTMYAI